MNAVYTYGCGTFLWHIFNAISLIFKDPLLMKGLLSAMAIFGTLWAFGKAAFGGNYSFLLKSWFLSIFLISNMCVLPKTTVHIIDTVDPNRKYSTVDNVPVGVVTIFSFATTVSHNLTKILETKMFPASESTFTKTGDFFGAKLIASVANLQISSPTDRSNLKQFVNRCFTWPYIYANVGGLRDEALKTNDIIKFLSENTHHWNGSYWTTQDGQTFASCKEGLARAISILQKEPTFSLPILADRIFGAGKKSDVVDETLNLKLQRLTKSLWDRLSVATDKAHALMDQMIMINTYKEARDDDREASEFNRLFPELVSLQAARTHTSGQMGAMIKGALAEYDIPSLYGSVMAILIILFPFVALMIWLPGGIQIFFMWVKLCIWVNLWPPFFVLFEALAAMRFEEAALSEMALSQGLSLSTYTGLTGLAFDHYTFFKGSLFGVPAISGFLLFGCLYGLSQYIGKMTGASEASADRMGADAVDGNLSFDNQNFSNRTMGSMSVSQQTLGPSLSFASRMDTGGISFVSDPTSGSIHADHHVSQMASNITSSDNFAASLNREISDVTSANEERRLGYEKSKSSHDQSTLSLVEGVTQGKVAVSGFSESENRDFQKLMEQGKQTSQSHGTDSLMENRVGANNTASAHIGVQAGGIIAKAVGIDVGGNASANIDSSASTSAIDKIAKENNWSEADKNLFTRGVQNIRTGNVEARDETSRNLASEQRENYEKMRQSSESYSAGISHSRNLQTAKSLQERGEISVVTAHNDDLMKEIADKNFGGNQMAAHQWANKNNDAWVRLGTDSLKEKSGTLFKALETNTDLSEDQVKNLFHQSGTKIEHESAGIETRNQSAGNLTDKYQEAQSQSSQKVRSSEAQLANEYNERGGTIQKVEGDISQTINKTSGEIFEHSANERNKGVIKRAWDNKISLGRADDVRSGTDSTIESKTLDHYMPEMKQAPTGQSYSQTSDSPSTLPTRSEKEVASRVSNTPSVDRSHDVSLKSESATSSSSMERGPVAFERNPKENLRETQPVKEEQTPPPSHPIPSPSRTPERQGEPHHSGDALHSLKKSVSPGLTSRDLETHKNPASLNKSHEEELSTSFKKTGSKG